MSRRKPVFLIAGDPGNRRSKSDPLLRTVFDNCGVSSPSIAYIGAANHDDRGFLGWVSDSFKKSGSGEVTLAPTVRRFERRSFEKTCQAADGVFVSGGDVEEGMNVVARRRLAPFFNELYRGGKLLFGVSAGSIMLARAWVRWKDEEDSVGCLLPCRHLVRRARRKGELGGTQGAAEAFVRIERRLRHPGRGGDSGRSRRHRRADGEDR